MQFKFLKNCSETFVKKKEHCMICTKNFYWKFGWIQELFAVVEETHCYAVNFLFIAAR